MRILFTIIIFLFPTLFVVNANAGSEAELDPAVYDARKEKMDKAMHAGFEKRREMCRRLEDPDNVSACLAQTDKNENEYHAHTGLPESADMLPYLKENLQ